MSLIVPLHKILSDQLFVLEHTEPDPASPSIIKAKELLKQSVEVYDPMQYENEKSVKLVQEADTLLKEETETLAKMYRSIALLILAAINTNQGSWARAGAGIVFALRMMKEILEEKTDGWIYFLIASTLALYGHNELIDLDLEEALEAYETSWNMYSSAMLWHVYHKEFPGGSWKLRKDLFHLEKHSVQRLSQVMGDFYFSQARYEKALEYYQFTAEISQFKPAEIFYESLLEEYPALQSCFEQALKSDVTKIEEMQSHLALARWMALLCLDRPDMDEMIQLFQAHFAQMAFWQRNPGAHQDISEENLDRLFFLPATILDSPLFQEARCSEKESRMAKEPEALYEQFKERFVPSISKREEEDEIECLGYINQSPREQELYERYKQSLAQAESFQGKDAAQEKKALDRARLYCAALVNQSPVLSKIEKYLIELTKIYLSLGAYYERAGELKKAEEFYQSAEYDLDSRDFKDVDGQLRSLIDVYDAFIKLYTQLGVENWVKSYTWRKEHYMKQFQREELQG